MMASIWVQWFVHSSLAGLLVLGLLHFGRFNTNASQRHFYLVISMVFMAVLPLLPSRQKEIGSTPNNLEAKQYVPLKQELVRSVHQMASSAKMKPVYLIWLFGCGLLLCWEIKGLASSNRFFSKARKPNELEISDLKCALRMSEEKIQKRVRVMESVGSPFTFGPGFIVLPPSLMQNTKDLKLAWTHEMAHIQRKDFAVELLLRICRILLWFQPLAWVLFQKAQEERELACDDAVICQGYNPQDYAQLLVQSRRNFSAVGFMALGQHPLKRRVISIINPHLKRGGIHLKSICLGTGTFALLAFSSTQLRQPQFKIGPTNTMLIEQFLVEDVIAEVRANPEKAADGAFLLLRIKEFFVTGKLQHIAATTGSYSVKEINELYAAKIGPTIDQHLPEFMALAAGLKPNEKLNYLQLLDHSNPIPGENWKVIDFFSPSPSLGFETPELGRLAALAWILSGHNPTEDMKTENASEKRKENLKWIQEHLIWEKQKLAMN